jgi:antitoxin YefM
MRQVSRTEFRANLGKYMDEVCENRAPLCVTRRNGRSAVMLAADEYESLIETLHLLGNPANAARLLNSIAEANPGRLIEHEV